MESLKSMKLVSVVADSSSWRSCALKTIFIFSIFLTVSLVVTMFIAPEQREMLYKWGIISGLPDPEVKEDMNEIRPFGSDTLPEGIVVKTTNLRMRPLWGSPKDERLPTNLFAAAAGIKQKDFVDKLVTKFLSDDFAVMLFHYDGKVEEWNEFNWSSRVIHVSAQNQTKWWFSKRFLHPDIVASYDYIFIWDEDLGVDDFHPKRYVSIVKSEGLEISQPALDPLKSKVHHQITARKRKSTVHRRIFKSGEGACDAGSTLPPCTAYVEMMAPVFSKAAWRCVWYMIQDDLIHAWGLDTHLGSCAQGDPTKNVGVVDAEYVVHYGLPTLGENGNTKVVNRHHTPRLEVRRQSFHELDIFEKRWNKAVEEDKSWSEYNQQKEHHN